MAPAVSDSEETAPGSAPLRAPGRSGPSKKRTLLAEQELRLLSTLVLLLGVGLFLVILLVPALLAVQKDFGQAITSGRRLLKLRGRAPLSGGQA